MKDDSIYIRLSASEKTAFQDAAQLAGITLSAWMRERLRTAARRDLEDAGLPIAFIKEMRRDDV